MTDIILEIIRAVITGAILVSLLWFGRNANLLKQSGWKYILAGFGLIYFGTIIDITDNFSQLNGFLIVGDTPYQSFLEKVVGYLCGFLLLAIGFWIWLPKVVKAGETESELMLINKQLKSEIAEREKVETTLGRNRELLKAILESTADGLLVVDRQGNVIHTNSKFAEMWRIPRRLLRKGKDEELLKSVLNQVSDQQSFLLKVKQLYNSMDSSYDSINFRDGRVFERNTQPLMKDGHVAGRVWSFRDITEKNNLQAEAARAAHLASVGELAAGVAHEINNPINSIMLNSQLLLDIPEMAEDEKSDIILNIKEGSRRITHIVKSLLTFARTNNNKKSISSIGGIIDDTLTLTSQQIKKSEIKIKVTVPPDLPPVMANEQEIEQVFINVVNNARYALNEKYSYESEEKKLEIKAEKIMLDDKPYVRTEFYDSGTGIPGDLIEKVINPFFTTKPPDSGTGLGLSISNGIISDHKGTMRIKSKDGEYTRVSIDLPAKNCT